MTAFRGTVITRRSWAISKLADFFKLAQCCIASLLPLDLLDPRRSLAAQSISDLGKGCDSPLTDSITPEFLNFCWPSVVKPLVNVLKCNEGLPTNRTTFDPLNGGRTFATEQ